MLLATGAGGSHPLFVAAEGNPQELRANPEILRRYFPARTPQVAPETIHFGKQKRPGVYRIVVQGGSTAAGFPYGRFASLAEMLGERLEATFPDREVEVISTAMAAVNSYTLLDFADEILEIEPDAVLIYAGHNEYLGVMGVASGLTPRRSRPATLLHLKLSRSRVYHYLRLLVARAGGLLGSTAQSPLRDETLMRRAAGAARVEFDSAVYRAGVRQLEANLQALLDVYREAGIPVYLGTLVSNDKDRPPFAGGDPDDDDSASTWFERGRTALAAGDAVTARDAFRNARDRDQLPFRAPEALNGAIHRLAQGEGVSLVDVQARFEAASVAGLIGEELLLEHVHPNEEGYFLLAEAYYEALREDGMIGDWSRAPSRDRARRDRPITQLDRILAEQAVRELENDFPFTTERREVPFPAPRDEIEGIAAQLHADEIGWLQAMERLMQLHREAGREGRAAVVARMAAQAFPSERATNFSAGMLYLRLSYPARARRYLDRSLAADPAHVATLAALVRANLALGAEPLARAHMARLRELAPDHPVARRLAH